MSLTAGGTQPCPQAMAGYMSWKIMAEIRCCQVVWSEGRRPRQAIDTTVGRSARGMSCDYHVTRVADKGRGLCMKLIDQFH